MKVSSFTLFHVHPSSNLSSDLSARQTYTLLLSFLRQLSFTKKKRDITTFRYCLYHRLFWLLVTLRLGRANLLSYFVCFVWKTSVSSSLGRTRVQSLQPEGLYLNISCFTVGYLPLPFWSKYPFLESSFHPFPFSYLSDTSFLDRQITSNKNKMVYVKTTGILHRNLPTAIENILLYTNLSWCNLI